MQPIYSNRMVPKYDDVRSGHLLLLTFYGDIKLVEKKTGYRFEHFNGFEPEITVDLVIGDGSFLVTNLAWCGISIQPRKRH